MDFNGPGPLQLLFAEQMDTWGIMYDFETSPIKDDLPGGWHAWSGSFYRDVIEHLRLAGYHFQQYSAYVRDNSTAVHAWGVMVAMAQLAPLGRIQTTAHRLLLYRSPNRLAYDAALLFQPGGPLFEALEGPTPRGRVPDHVWGHFVHAPIVLQVLPALPRGTRDSDAARDPANWVGGGGHVNAG